MVKAHTKLQGYSNATININLNKDPKLTREEKDFTM